MSEKIKRHFAIWMDTQHATIAGPDENDHNRLVILGHAKYHDPGRSPGEAPASHTEITKHHKFFKEIAAKIVNPDAIHLTGTGKIQEEFRHYLSETPRFKHAALSDDTSNKMEDERFLHFAAAIRLLVVVHDRLPCGFKGGTSGL